MYALRGPNAPTPDEVEESLCGSCMFGTCVVTRARPDNGASPGQVWITRSFCRNLAIAGSGGTHEFDEQVYACDKYAPDPQQEESGDVPRAD